MNAVCFLINHSLRLTLLLFLYKTQVPYYSLLIDFLFHSFQLWPIRHNLAQQQDSQENSNLQKSILYCSKHTALDPRPVRIDDVAALTVRDCFIITNVNNRVGLDKIMTAHKFFLNLKPFAKALCGKPPEETCLSLFIIVFKWLPKAPLCISVSCEPVNALHVPESAPTRGWMSRTLLSSPIHNPIKPMNLIRDYLTRSHSETHIHEAPAQTHSNAAWRRPVRHCYPAVDHYRSRALVLEQSHKAQGYGFTHRCNNP